MRGGRGWEEGEVGRRERLGGGRGKGNGNAHRGRHYSNINYKLIFPDYLNFILVYLPFLSLFLFPHGAFLSDGI